MTNTQYINLDRTVIAVSGSDAYKFLQGLLTNDVGKVTEKSAIYSYLLTPQGKYLFDFFVIKKADQFLIEIDEKYKDEFIKKLKMYKLRSDVAITDLSASYAVFAVMDNSKGYHDPRNKNMLNRIVLEKSAAQNLQLDNIEKYHQLRIENNIPEGDDLEKDKSYPLQYRMVELNGVDFNKGCYVGQEVTARTHHRGVIRKNVYKIEGQGNLTKGAEILNNDEIIGKVLTVVGNKALAVLEVEAAGNPENKLISNDKPLQVIG